MNDTKILTFAFLTVARSSISLIRTLTFFSN